MSKGQINLFFSAGIVVMSLIALGVVGTVIYMAIQHPEIALPQTLADWGGMILGFYFGSLIGFLKDLLPRSES